MLSEIERRSLSAVKMKKGYEDLCDMSGGTSLVNKERTGIRIKTRKIGFHDMTRD